MRRPCSRSAPRLSSFAVEPVHAGGVRAVAFPRLGRRRLTLKGRFSVGIHNLDLELQPGGDAAEVIYERSGGHVSALFFGAADTAAPGPMARFPWNSSFGSIGLLEPALPCSPNASC